MKADLMRDHIKVEGKPISKPEKKVYYAFNKPRGVMTSMSDPSGRPTVNQFFHGIRQRVFPVGRLDYDSEGLLLLTNDGDFAYSILHPSKKVPKTYLVKIKGVLEDEDIDKLRKGIKLDGRMTAPAKVKKLRKAEANSWIEMTIHEGRKRQIRRMLERLGHDVIRLMRIRINGIEMGPLEPGTYRKLTNQELDTIMREIGTGESA
jgi:23S rRNA pseudouridine2605 synthase